MQLVERIQALRCCAGTRAVRWAIFGAALLVGLSSIASAGPVATGTQIPVVINIYNNAGISEADAKAAVEKASEMLKQAGYKLTVVKVNKNADGGDADKNGDITPAEEAKVVEAGKKEIDKTPNKKGIKISFTRTPDTSSTTPGWCYHDEPVVVAKNRGNAQLTGETIAHEIGHILTLGTGHKIDKDTTADNGGHAPDKNGASGNDNLMSPSNRRTGTKLTQAQINEIKKKKYVRGKCATQWDRAYPATKDKHQFGTKTDNLGDQVGLAPAYVDIFSTTLSSIDGDPAIIGQLSLGGLFTGTVTAQYSLALNSDNNPLTGRPYGPFLGMEYVLEMYVAGAPGALTTYGQVRNLMDNTTVPLPGPLEIVDAEFLSDLGGHGGWPELDQIRFGVPKAMVGLPSVYDPTLPEIPVGVLSVYDVGTAGGCGVLGLIIPADTDELTLNLDQWLRDPSLKTFGDGGPRPGAPYDIVVLGLQPYDTCTVYVDARPVCTGELDWLGNAFLTFPFPADLPNHHMYFLTAQDSTGEFAYNITCPEPVTTLPQAKTLPDLAYCDLNGIPVVESFFDIFYIETPSRTTGICVYEPDHTMSRCMAARVAGQMRTDSDGERYIDAETADPVGGYYEVRPWFMANRAIGGGDTLGQIGVFGGVGLNNVGLFVRTTGRVTYVDPEGMFCYVDDGSALYDGNLIGTPQGVGVRGLRVLPSMGAPLPPEGAHVCRNGVSTIETVAGRPVRALLMVSEALPGT